MLEAGSVRLIAAEEAELDARVEFKCPAAWGEGFWTGAPANRSHTLAHPRIVLRSALVATAWDAGTVRARKVQGPCS